MTSRDDGTKWTRLRLTCFIIGIVMIFIGVTLSIGLHGEAGWEKGVGVWALLIGTLDTLISQPWK